MNVLFICSANKQRSKTAEDHFQVLYPQHHFQSAGTNHKICTKEGTTPLQIEHLIWADQIFVMESRHLEIIRNHLSAIAQDSSFFSAQDSSFVSAQGSSFSSAQGSSFSSPQDSIISDTKEPLQRQSKGTSSNSLEILISKITVLNIEDIYVYGDLKLVEVLEGKLSSFFQ